MFVGVKGIAKRAVKDTAKAAIGVDQAEVNRRADRSQVKIIDTVSIFFVCKKLVFPSSQTHILLLDVIESAVSRTLIGQLSPV